MGSSLSRRSCWSRPPPPNLERSWRSGSRRPVPCYASVTQPQQSIQAAVTINRRGARHPVAEYLDPRQTACLARMTATTPLWRCGARHLGAAAAPNAVDRAPLHGSPDSVRQERRSALGAVITLQRSLDPHRASMVIRLRRHQSQEPGPSQYNPLGSRRVRAPSRARRSPRAWPYPLVVDARSAPG